MSVPLDAAGIDYHVVLAQNALQQCVSSTELQAELLCALMKQTSRHLQHKIGVQVNPRLLLTDKLRHSKRRVSFFFLSCNSTPTHALSHNYLDNLLYLWPLIQKSNHNLWSIYFSQNPSFLIFFL
jgi:MyTH4 domain